MIISHKHKFIFIKTQKTAGSSIKLALAKFCDNKDIISSMGDEDNYLKKKLGYRGAQNNYLPYKAYWKRDWFNYLYNGFRYNFTDHMSAKEIKLRFKNEWKDYYTFCFERNPFDKFISWYYWDGGDKRHGNMTQFIQSGAASKIKGFELYTDNSEIIIDKVYKYEELNESLLDIQNVLNLPNMLKLPEQKLKGNVRKEQAHYKDILTDFEVDWIRKVFAREMVYFNYSF